MHIGGSRPAPLDLCRTQDEKTNRERHPNETDSHEARHRKEQDRDASRPSQGKFRGNADHD
jgi:hypothetical protein